MMMGFGFGFLWMFLFWGVLLVLLIGRAALALCQTAGTRLSGQQHGPTARQVLDERLARGEITQEEYEALRAQIVHVN
jgi:putative membrane protein